MNDEDKQARIWNMNAHFAWSLAMWGSGEHARNTGSTLLASVGHYYAAFHAGFSVACTDHTINLKDYERVDHGTVHRWTRRLLGDAAADDFDRLRRMRETLNYMGVGDPLMKLQLVRGNMAGFDFDGTKVSFEEAVARASNLSRAFISTALSSLEAHGATAGWSGPKRGDTTWQDEYLQEDLLRTRLQDRRGPEAGPWVGVRSPQVVSGCAGAGAILLYPSGRPKRPSPLGDPGDTPAIRRVAQDHADVDIISA